MPTEGVEFQTFGEWESEIVKSDFLGRIGIPDAEILAFKGIFAWIEPDRFGCHSAIVIFDFESVIWRSALIDVYPIVLPRACKTCAIGAHPVAPFSRKVQKTGFADFHTVVGVSVPCIAIPFIGLTPIEVCVTRIDIVFQYNVNNASNGIRSVLCSGTIAKNFNTFYRR